ncbi:MAG: extracellular solute-binding protein [bacterium]|nr:extracellular solute-binding protein [bacterium]
MKFKSFGTMVSIGIFALALGCVPQAEDSVVVYSAADREYAAPILAAFSRKAGVEVLPVFDVESTKTAGLVARLESEADRPRCDVFWNNEIMHTLRLDAAGLLEPVGWQVPVDWPANMRGSQGTWIGIGARARILIVNRELLPADGKRPDSVLDLANPEWKGQCVVAEPLFGTTATHFAVLKATLEPAVAEELFRSIRQNAIVVAGNKQVAQMVSSGQAAFGLTDTDDALVEMDAGLPVEIVFPDQGDGQSGTLMIPNTIAVIRGGPHPTAARALANFLISEDTEGRLAMGVSGQFPVRPDHPQTSRAIRGQNIRWMDADFEAAAAVWPELSDALRSMFRGPSL